jgi:hypothetical protein
MKKGIIVNIGTIGPDHSGMPITISLLRGNVFNGEMAGTFRAQRVNESQMEVWIEGNKPNGQPTSTTVFLSSKRLSNAKIQDGRILLN